MKKENISVDIDDLNIKCYVNKVNLSHFKDISIKRILGKNLYTDFLLNKIVKLITYKEFDIIGISIGNYTQYLTTLALARKIKENVNIPIILGGPYITLLDNFTLTHILKKYNFVDYLGIGDGELTLLNLIKFLLKKEKLESVPGLMYIYKGKIRKNEKFDLDINEQCCPDFDLLPIHLYKKINQELTLTYRINRGCTHKCDFCIEHKLSRLQFKNVEKIINELKYLILKYGFKYVWFGDSACNLNYNHLEKICMELINKKLSISWKAQARADNLDKKILIKMKKSGCVGLEFGLESASSRIIKKMGKGIDTSQIERILKECHNLGIINSINLIVGYPLEEDEDVDETINFIKKNIQYISQINLSGFALLYCSYIFNHSDEYNITNLKNSEEFPLTYTFDKANLDYKVKKFKNVEKIINELKLFQNKIKINISI